MDKNEKIRPIVDTVPSRCIEIELEEYHCADEQIYTIGNSFREYGNIIPKSLKSGA